MTLRMNQLWSLLEADISYPNLHCLNYRLVPKISEQWVGGAKVSGISDKEFSRLFKAFLPNMITIFILQGSTFISPSFWNASDKI